MTEEEIEISEATEHTAPRHTGLRYDIVARDGCYCHEYSVVASALIPADARDIVKAFSSTYSGTMHIIVDTVKGEILS